eukprot:COSAG02_NODE_12_length_58022_cov_242.077379_24_plen_66_part_00
MCVPDSGMACARSDGADMTAVRCRRRRFVPVEARSSAVGTSGWRRDDTELWLIKLPQGVRLLQSR